MKIIKQYFYSHHYLSMFLIILILIPNLIVSISIDEVNKRLGFYFFVYIFFCIYVYFFILLGFLIYKILTEKYFVSIFLIIGIEGFFFIFYTLIYYYFAIENYKQIEENIHIKNQIMICILQIIINLSTKAVIFYFNEIYSYIALLLVFSIKIVIHMLKKEYKVVGLIIILLNLLLIFSILIYIEVIIIVAFDLEQKTKKYLILNQKKEKDDIIKSLETKNDDSINAESSFNSL